VEEDRGLFLGTRRFLGRAGGIGMEEHGRGMFAAGGIGRSVVVHAGQGQSRGLLGAVVGYAEGATRTRRRTVANRDCRPTLSVTVLPVCKIDR
jgi:hypothetical protein